MPLRGDKHRAGKGKEQAERNGMQTLPLKQRGSVLSRGIRPAHQTDSTGSGDRFILAPGRPRRQLDGNGLLIRLIDQFVLFNKHLDRWRLLFHYKLKRFSRLNPLRLLNLVIEFEMTITHMAEII